MKKPKKSWFAPATPRQIAYMDAHGIWYPAKCTKKDAMEFIIKYQQEAEQFNEDRHPHDVDNEDYK